jgi:predicted dehydrogenase
MKPITRRQFLKSSLAASAAVVAPFNILPAGASPNSKLNIACIGVGGQGGGDASGFLKTDNVIALCDVDEPWHKHRNAKRPELHGIKLWKDYREMFDKIGDEIDAVSVSTPDHSHFAISMHAIRQGKHVYTQKPLCHTVNEVRLLTEEARKHPKVITQMGHQGHSSASSARIKDWGLANTIGPVREVVAYSRKNYWTDQSLQPPTTPRNTIDWDLYLNRAGEIPFSKSYMDRNWIKYIHFSGTVGDMAAHIFDPAYYALDLRVPLSVRADVDIPASPISNPRAGVITWEFAARGDKPPVSLKYYLGDGIEFPYPKHREPGHDEVNSGSVLIGENASILVGSHSQEPEIIGSKEVLQDLPEAPKAAFRCKGRHHYENFTLACKGEDTIMSPFEYAGPLSEIIVLGDIALQHPGKTLLWDAEGMKITNDEAANQDIFMRRPAARDDMNWY